MGTIRTSQTTTALPLSTLKSNKHDNTVDMSAPVKAAEAVEDLQGAIDAGSAGDKVRIATGVDGEKVTYTEISKDEAKQLLGELKEKLAHGENINLSRVEIPSSTSEKIQLSYASETPETAPGAHQAHPAAQEGSTEELLHKAEHSGNEHEFAIYAEEMLHAKFGLKNEQAGAIAKNLFIAYHEPDPVKKAKAIAQIVIRLNEIKPQGQALIQRMTAPLLQNLPAKSPVRSILTKLIGEKDKSDTRIGHIATLMNGKFDGLKDVRAMYELLNDFGPDVKALLPDNVKEHIDKLTTLFGAKLGEHVKGVLATVLPNGANSDFVKATLKYVTGDGIGKLSAGIDFLNSVGKRIVGADNETLKAIYGFLKIDSRTADSLRHLLNPHAPVQLRAEALEHLAHEFHHRLEHVIHEFHIEGGDEVLKEAHAHPHAENPGGEKVNEHPTGEKVPEKPPETPHPTEGTSTTGGDGTKVATAETKLTETAAAREAQLAEKAEKLGLNAEAKAALTKILGNEHVDEGMFKAGMEMLEKMGPEQAQAALDVLKHMEPDIARRVFTNGELGSKVLKGMLEMMPALQKLGMGVAEIAPKLAKGLGKALPIAGGLVSGYDAARLGTIAATGKDFKGKEYKDPDVRALALLGAGANGLDTALAVIEATGVGNVDLPVQLGLAGAEVCIDLMVEYYNEHPDKMPESLRTGIKAASLAVAVGAPFALPGAGLMATAAVANIYGLDGTIDIATTLTKMTGEGVLHGIDKIEALKAKALDKGLEGMTNGINGLADVVRNPEKYAQQLGKSVEEVMSQAYDLLKKKAGEGIEAAKQVYGVLKDIATNPGAYAQKAVDFAIDTGMKIGKEVGTAAVAAGRFIKDMAVNGVMAIGDGCKALYQMGADGVKAAKDLMASAIRKGGQLADSAIAFAKDVVNNPGKYGQMAGEMAADAVIALRDAVKAGLSKAGDALIALKDMAARGIESACQGLKDVVAAGGAMAIKALTFVSELPEKAAHAVGEGLKAAYSAGKATYDMAKWVAQHPQETLQKLGDAGKQVLTSTRDWLVNRAKNVKQGVEETMQYLDDLYSRTGAALGRFGDTVVDLMKQGVNVGEKIVGRYWDVIKTRGPELMSALGNLGQAGLDLMTKIGKWHTDAAKWVVDGLSNAAVNAGAAVKSYALQKLNEIGATDAIVNLVNRGKVAVNDLKRMGSQAVAAIQKYGSPEAIGQLLKSGMVEAGALVNSLMSQGAAGMSKLVQIAGTSVEMGKAFVSKVMGELKGAWDKCTLTNGCAPLRELIGQYLDKAAAAGGQAATWVKNQLVNALDSLDKSLEKAQEGNWVPISIPDALIDALR